MYRHHIYVYMYIYIYMYIITFLSCMSQFRLYRKSSKCIHTFQIVFWGGGIHNYDGGGNHNHDGDCNHTCDGDGDHNYADGGNHNYDCGRNHNHLITRTIKLGRNMALLMQLCENVWPTRYA